MSDEKSLLQKIMELFRLPRFSRPAAESESQRDDEADVTVEREPDTASEDAVKGTATADETAATDTADGPASGDAAPTGEGTPVEEIKGIGPTYAGRLEDAGIATVEALAGSDPEHVATVAQASETKAGNWVDRANEY